MPTENVARLALCKSPTPNTLIFASALNHIAAYAGADKQALSSSLRLAKT
jgi:hypothetical protein